MHLGKHKSNTLKPIVKYNGGRGATLCHNCRVIINEGFSDRLYCDTCGPNKVTYLNRYRDKIIFEHIGDEVVMTGGTWFRYGWPNVYDKAYEKYVMSAVVDAKLEGEQILTQEEFEKVLFVTKDEDKSENNALYKIFGKYIYSDTTKIDFVDPSGGPYISLGDNLNRFWKYGDGYQDLIVDSIKFISEEGKTKEDYKSTIVFKIK